jgi:prolipoprotein diacylglyceryltransferase
LRSESQAQQENEVTFTLGPLVLQASHVLLALLFCVAAGIGRLAGRRKKIGISSVLLDMALAALAAGRIGFVLTRLGDFRAAPWWSVFDIRDGGSYLPAAFAGALAVAVWRCWRKPDLRMPLAAGLLAALFAWDLGGTRDGAAHARWRGHRFQDAGWRQADGGEFLGQLVSAVPA